MKLTHVQSAEEKEEKQWGSEGQSVQEKGRFEFEKKLKGEGQSRGEGRKIHSQSQLSSPGLWDTVKEGEGKRKEETGK